MDPAVAGVTDPCEPPDMGAENQIRILEKAVRIPKFSAISPIPMGVVLSRRRQKQENLEFQVANNHPKIKSELFLAVFAHSLSCDFT